MNRPVGRASDRGQSSVEFALVLPIVLVVVLLAVQVGLVVSAKIATMQTAREVARVASLDPTVDVDRIAGEVAPLATTVDAEVRFEVAPLAGERMVVVTVTQAVPNVLDRLLPNMNVSSTAMMLVEAAPP